jgi:uncharacterized protein (DUF952 family)
VSFIYHLVAPQVWEQVTQKYRADSLAREGFIHCSYAEQVAGSANRFYADAPGLVVLHINSSQLASPLTVEAAASGELFPHIYGPINRDAVVKVQSLERAADGLWVFHP